MSVLSALFLTIYILSNIYYAILVLSFILSWFRSLYGTRFFQFIMRLTTPFRKIFSNKLIVGSFDLGSTLGLVLYGWVSSIFLNLSYMV